eukprot:282544-Pleurochrysis_carterae.AAC.2
MMRPARLRPDWTSCAQEAAEDTRAGRALLDFTAPQLRERGRLQTRPRPPSRERRAGPDVEAHRDVLEQGGARKHGQQHRGASVRQRRILA